MVSSGDKNMSAKPKTRRHRAPQSDIARVLYQLASRCKDPERFVELFYWSQEPVLAELMRGFIAMPDEAKYTLHTFLRLAEGNLQSIAVTANTEGDITLSSSTVTGLLTITHASGRPKSAQPLH